MWDKVEDYYKSNEKENDPYEFAKNYQLAEDEYDQMRETLQTRVEDINYNQYLYDTYRCRTNKYNSDTENRVDDYLNYYNSTYTNKFNNWKGKRTNYFNKLNRVKGDITSQYNTNKRRYNNKINEINNKRNKYGELTLYKGGVKRVPSPGNYGGVIQNKKDNFDSDNKPGIGSAFKSSFNASNRNQISNSSNPKNIIYNLYKEEINTPDEVEGSKKYKINNKDKELKCSLGYKEYLDSNYNAKEDGMNKDVIRWNEKSNRYKKVD